MVLRPLLDYESPDWQGLVISIHGLTAISLLFDIVFTRNQTRMDMAEEHKCRGRVGEVNDESIEQAIVSNVWWNQLQSLVWQVMSYLLT